MKLLGTFAFGVLLLAASVLGAFMSPRLADAHHECDVRGIESKSPSLAKLKPSLYLSPLGLTCETAKTRDYQQAIQELSKLCNLSPASTNPEEKALIPWTNRTAVDLSCSKSGPKYCLQEFYDLEKAIANGIVLDTKRCSPCVRQYIGFSPRISLATLYYDRIENQDKLYTSLVQACKSA